MPDASKKACSYPGCIVLVTSGRCNQHRQADINYRDPNAQRLYNQAYWRTTRKNQLSKEPWCEICLEQGLYIMATDVHHVTRHRGDVLLFRTSKLQSLCPTCHARATAQERINDNG